MIFVLYGFEEIFTELMFAILTLNRKTFFRKNVLNLMLYEL